MLLYLKIKPNQRFDRIEKVDDEWVVKVKAPAIDGKANIHLVEFLSIILKISKSRILLKKGHTGRNKCLEIDADEATILERLQKASLHSTL